MSCLICQGSGYEYKCPCCCPAPEPEEPDEWIYFREDDGEDVEYSVNWYGRENQHGKIEYNEKYQTTDKMKTIETREKLIAQHIKAIRILEMMNKSELKLRDIMTPSFGSENFNRIKDENIKKSIRLLDVIKRLEKRYKTLLTEIS